MRNSFGAVFIGFGYEYLLMATYAALSFKQYNPDAPAKLITNVAGAEGSATLQTIFEFIEVLSLPDRDCLKIKSSVFEHSPFDKTVLLDADSVALASFKEMEHALERFEMAAVLRYFPIPLDDKIDNELRLRDFSYWHTGILFFRKTEQVEAYFRYWAAEYIANDWAGDQESFAKAQLNRPLAKFLSLDMRWCLSDQYKPIHHKLKDVDRKVFHYTDVFVYPRFAKGVLDVHFSLSAEGGISVAVATSAAIEKKLRFCASSLWNNPFSPIARRVGSFLYRKVSRKRTVFHKKRAWKEG